MIRGRMICLATILALGTAALRDARGQVTLSDDIILATQGKENAEKNRRSNLGRPPGDQGSPYRRSPGSNDVQLGVDPNRRVGPLPRPTRRATDPGGVAVPGPDRGGLAQGLAPAIERLRLPPARPQGGGGPGVPGLARGPEPLPTGDDPEDDGPPDGLTLDAAIDRLVHCNLDLKSKALEIPQADADILTVGLRENPLLFYSSDGVPYGSYSPGRPGEIDHELSLVLPIDYSGKRKARINLARREKCVLEAQYRNAVRLAIDDLYNVFNDILAERQAVRAAERGLNLFDRLLAEAQARQPRTDGDDEAIDNLAVERELATISLGDERARFDRARQRLGTLLAWSPAEADGIELLGSFRRLDPAPPGEILAAIALGNRPDLAAYRLGITRAEAEHSLERAERLSDIYFLYSPFEYRDNSHIRLNSIDTWGAGIFVSAPLFNRNQGNIRRARLNVQQSQIETSAIREQVLADVRQALQDFNNTADDAQRLERTILPAIRRKRDRSWRRLVAGEITTDEFLAAERDTSTLVRYHRETLIRHRRNALRINTAVGRRVMP